MKFESSKTKVNPLVPGSSPGEFTIGYQVWEGGRVGELHSTVNRVLIGELVRIHPLPPCLSCMSRMSRI